MKIRSVILAGLCLVATWHFTLSFFSGFCVGHKCGVVHDYYPMWNASRAILHREDPYRLAVTQQNQIMSYGATAKSVGIKDEQRFAYPVFATFPLLPLGTLNFPRANNIAFWLFAVLTAFSVGWLRGKWDSTTLLYGTLTFSSMPVIVGLELRQPTLFFFGLAVASFALLRAGYLVPAALLAALSAGKPQVALPVLLPMLVWGVAKWRERKRFVIWLGTFSLGLLLVGLMATPGWIPKWLATLHAYSRYTEPSIIISLFGSYLGSGISGLLLLGWIAILWRCRRSELLFLMALSVGVVQLIMPTGRASYNAILLLIPALWVADNADFLAARGKVNQFLLAAVRFALIVLWVVGAVGGLFVNHSEFARLAGWALVKLTTRGLFWCLLATMIAQLFSDQSPMKKLGFQVSPSRLQETEAGPAHLTYVLDHSPAWRAIYSDNVAVLFERAPAAAVSSNSPPQD